MSHYRHRSQIQALAHQLTKQISWGKLITWLLDIVLVTYLWIVLAHNKKSRISTNYNKLLDMLHLIECVYCIKKLIATGDLCEGRGVKCCTEYMRPNLSPGDSSLGSELHKTIHIDWYFIRPTLIFKLNLTLLKTISVRTKSLHKFLGTKPIERRGMLLCTIWN